MKISSELPMSIAKSHLTVLAQAKTVKSEQAIISGTSVTNEVQNKTNSADDNVTLSEEALKLDAQEQEKNDLTLEVSDESEGSELTLAEQQQSLKEEITKLALEIMELSMKIEQLKAKGDEESLKESRELETDLALKKAELTVKQEQLLALGT